MLQLTFLWLTFCVVTAVSVPGCVPTPLLIVGIISGGLIQLILVTTLPLPPCVSTAFRG